MFGNLLLFAANRATEGAAGNVARLATWGGLAVFLLLAGATFTLMVLFWLLQASVGPLSAAVILAAGCFVAALISLSIPHLLSAAEAKAAKVAPQETTTPVHDAAEAVHEDMTDAVDYFGSLRVVVSAFMLGLGVARSLKHRTV